MTQLEKLSDLLNYYRVLKAIDPDKATTLYKEVVVLHAKWKSVLSSLLNR